MDFKYTPEKGASGGVRIKEGANIRARLERSILLSDEKVDTACIIYCRCLVVLIGDWCCGGLWWQFWVRMCSKPGDREPTHPTFFCFRRGPLL